MSLSGPVGKHGSHLNTVREPVLTLVNIWEGHASQQVCEGAEGQTACYPYLYVPPSSDRLREQVVGLSKRKPSPP